MIKKLKLLLFFIILSLFTFNSLTVYGVSLSPLRQTVTLDRGESKTLRVQVENNEDNQIRLAPRVDSFKTHPKEGYPVFNQEDSAESWLNYNKNTFVLEPGESRSISFELSVPQRVQSKAHYLALFVEKQGSGGEIAANSRVGSLLFLYVSGAVKESLMLAEFSAEKFGFSSPIGLNLSFKNKGDIHVKPQGQLVVSNQRGEQIFKKKLDESLITPGNYWERSYDVSDLSWQDIGKNKATVYAQYGIKNKPVSDTISFWYLPYKFLAPIVLLLILISSWFLFNRYRQSN